MVYGAWFISGLHYTGPPPAPSNVVVETENFQTDHFSIKLSWDSQNTALVDTYRISINNTAEFVETDTTMHIFEGKYDYYLTINISAVNCAGRSEGVVVEVYEGITKLFSYSCLQPWESYIRGENMISSKTW